MAYNPPRKNVEYIFYIGLISQTTGQLQTNPTIAAGDFKVSTDGGGFGNLGTLPAVTPAGGKAVKVTLSASEMNGDNVVVIGSDAAGAEWDDIVVSIQPSIAYSADGVIDANVVQLSSDTAAANNAESFFDGTGYAGTNNTIPTVTSVTNRVTANTDRWAGQTIPAPAVTGVPKVDLTDIDGLATNGNNATLNLKQLSIINNAGTAAFIRSTGNNGSGINILGNGSGTGVRIIADSIDGTGLLIEGGIAAEIYGDNDTAVYIAGAANGDGVNIQGAGTGKSINAPQDIAVSDGDLTLGAIADAAWDELIADHLGMGSTGEKLNSAGAAGDPWSTALPGAYGPGTAGNIVGNNLDAAISTRSTLAQADIINDATPFAGADIDAAISSRAAPGDAMALTPTERNSTATALLDLAGAIESNVTLREALRLIAAATAGKLSGAATATITIRNARADDKSRIIATVDADGNRTAIVYDVS